MQTEYFGNGRISSIRDIAARLGIANRRDRALIVDSVNPERLENHPIRLTRRVLTQVFE